MPGLPRRIRHRIRLIPLQEHSPAWVHALRRYLIAGLLLWVPLVATVAIIKFIVDAMDRTLLLPPAWRPEALLGFTIPGFGVVVAVAIVFTTGLVVANLVGRKLVELWEGLLARIPLVNTIYSAIKQVVETVLGTTGESFRKVLLVEYPRKGVWALGFQTQVGVGEVQERTEKEVVTVFVPTTPNPTSGFILLVPRDEVIEMDMTVEDGLKFVMSLGVVVPRPSQIRRATPAAPPETGGE
ncbi:Uncharacterized membrane protein [Ectothiorhodospira mobilis]|uniref:Uncharacterized membrane protein n=1 Tax=Ectothiorhodospira mobilis TaxID=195064 RepID=A0A1I4S3C5_ECTMO|nr:Uncharacterized membrane protein [Ectothiorhodospira mobilis]